MTPNGTKKVKTETTVQAAIPLTIDNTPVPVPVSPSPQCGPEVAGPSTPHSDVRAVLGVARAALRLDHPEAVL